MIQRSFCDSEDLGIDVIMPNGEKIKADSVVYSVKRKPMKVFLQPEDTEENKRKIFGTIKFTEEPDWVVMDNDVEIVFYSKRSDTKMVLHKVDMITLDSLEDNVFMFVAAKLTPWGN